MPRKRRVKAMVALPKNVQRVPSRGRVYFYHQQGRGTASPGPRTRLPDDPQSPEFWEAVRQAEGATGIAAPDSVGSLIDRYMLSSAYGDLAETSKEQYDRALATARTAWGNLPLHGLRPVHVQAILDGLAAKRATANIFLSVMRKLASWGRARDIVHQNFTDGLMPHKTGGGHKPWTEAQILAAHERLDGMLRRGVMLALYTGQRGSDIVRLGWTDIEDGGFRLRQRKTSVEVWCPIVPELQAEMATWEKRPGPFLLNKIGRPYTREKFAQHFAETRVDIPELREASIHGLRATAVVRLRREGLSAPQIGDIIGMSLPMIERYCRFADKKANGQAALINLTERARNASCKIPEKRKTKSQQDQ